MRKLFFSSVVLAGLLAAGQAGAAKFVLSPVTMSLNPSQGLTTSTTLTNTDTTPVQFTAEIKLWTQVDGKDVLVPTRDAVVSPMNFKVAAGKSQVVRVGLRRAPQNSSVTYRLILTQVVEPAPATDKKMVVTPRYIFSLPLFVESDEAKANVSITAERTATGLNLVFKNDGNGYGVYRGMQALLGEKAIDLGSQYVLPGSTMRVALPPELQGVGTFTFSATTADQQVTKVVVRVP